MAIQLVLIIMLAPCLVGASFGNTQSLAKPGCANRCGNVMIPYPFGIGPTCSGHESYTITCNTSFFIQRPFLTSINLEVLEISLNGTIRVNSPVFTLDCDGQTPVKDVNMSNTNRSYSDYYSLFSMLYGQGLDLSSSVFTFSRTNRLTTTGCYNIAIFSTRKSILGGCISYCNPVTMSPFFNQTSACLGEMCCQTEIPPSLNHLYLSLARTSNPYPLENCKTALIVDQDWFSNLKNLRELRYMDHVPTVLDWSCNTVCSSFDTLKIATKRSVSLCGNNSFCSDRKLCQCVDGYEGNPYLPDGCQDVDECEDSSLNRCAMLCTNTPGSYSCSCLPGYYKSNEFDCHITPTYGNGVRNAFVVPETGLGLLLLSVAVWQLGKVIIKLRKNQLKKKLFKRNGGLLLQKQLSSGQINIDNTKLFTSKELEKATDCYNMDRILGRGGQGTVYKGMLSDGKIVAIKRSKLKDEAKLELFINEVVILSQINHRNVVKLHGCCLETEVPMLVYEFIPNGNLYQYIHDKKEDFPLTWEIRLRVATEIAEALSYLHSATLVPVYHRDIKSTNILLDEKFRAKVADFGTSRSIVIDQTHLTTRVQGTFGYLDPEYFRSSQFTEKSDVYSFGVVLVELLTGQKPIISTESDEMLSLATYFIMAMKGKHLFDIVDARVLKEGKKEEIMQFAHLAKRCLNMNGRKRPTMKELAMELGVILTSHRTPITDKYPEKVNYNASVPELYVSWNARSPHMGKYSDSDISVLLPKRIIMPH